MSHLLETVNPQAAAEADSGWKPAGPVLGDAVVAADWPVDSEEPACAPIPGIGNLVVYHLRAGDSRNRRTKFPAIVMDGDEQAGTLMLWIIVDDGDTWMQEHVRPRAAPEQGWEPVALWMPTLQARDELSQLSTSDLQSPGAVINTRPSDYEIFVGLEARLAALESKRGPGRPPKDKTEG